MYHSGVWDGETFADDDITPRPLRIIKRECNTVSDFSYARDSSAGDSSDEVTGRPMSMPMSMSSYDVVNTDNGLSGSAKSRRQAPIQNAKRQVLPQTLSHASDALHVPKQRRTNLKTTRVSSAFGSIVGDTLSNSSARIRDRSPRRSPFKTMGQKSEPEDRVQAIAAASHRAATTGSLGDECLSRPCTELPASQLAPKPLLISIRSRAVTTDCVAQGGSDLAALQNHSLGRSRVQPSLRHRLFSRVMHGVGGKANVSQAALEREAVGRSLRANNTGNVEPVKSAHIGRPRPASASSAETASTWAGGIDLALAAFPTPPKSTVTSPTTMSSFETTSAGSVVSRVLSKPPNAAVPSVQLNALSEVNELELGCGQSLSVAVEITADVGTLDRTIDVAVQAKGLDVAIVIDSSLFTSPAALIASCEAARFISSLLSPNTDRLAVLSTRPQRTDAPDFNIVSPLSRTSIRQIKSAVDSIVSSTERPEPAALATALHYAIDLLTDAPAEVTDSEPQGDAYGHVFVLSGNTHGISPNLLDHERLSVHVVCPGSVPWEDPDGVSCNGWRLGSLYSSSLQSMSLKKDFDQGSLFNRLRKIVILARSGKVCGQLTDLVLDIQAGPACTIERVMGSKIIARLHPGEVITALVKVKVGLANVAGFTAPPSLQRQCSIDFASSADLLNELETMLGTSSAPILIAKLTYRHSLLPTGTRCSTIAAAKLKPSAPDRGLERNSKMTIESRAAETRMAVQKRHIRHLATHHAPRHAIRTLREHFGDNGRESLCPEYVKLVTAELKYQARVVERFELTTSTRVSPCVGRDASLSNTYEHFGQGLFNVSNYMPQDWLTGAVDEDSSSRRSTKTGSTDQTPKRAHGGHGHHKAGVLRTGSVRQVVSRPSARQAGVLPISNRRNSGAFGTTNHGLSDEGRRVSGDIRHASTGDRRSMNSGRPSGVSGTSAAEKSRDIKDIRGRNKRIIGIEGLVGSQGRGLAKAKENVAPRL